MVQFIKENKAFSVVFGLAILIRFIPVFNYQFSYDELCGLRNSLFTNWHDLVEYGVKLDTHPILVQLIINAIVKTIGYSEFWVKLPFLLFSLATIIYAYLFGKKWFGTLPALISSSVFSFSYIFLFYAPLARMYSGGLFFSTALVYYVFNLCFGEEKKKRDYILVVLFVLLCALNNHLSCLFAFTVAAFGLFFQTKKTILFYLGACLAAVILYLPHLNITLAQLGQGGIGHSQDGWLAAPDKFAIFYLIKTLFGTGYVWIAFALALIVSFIINTNSVLNKKAFFLFTIFLLNYFIIYFYSVNKAPIFQYSVMLFSAPCFIWAFASLLRLNERAGMLVVSCVSGLLIVQSVFVKNFFENGVLNQNEFQFNKYEELSAKYERKNLDCFFFGTQPYFVVLYEAKNNKRIRYTSDPDAETIRLKLIGSKADYVLLGDADPKQIEMVKDFYPYLIEYKQCLNVNYCLYSRVKTELPKGVYEACVDSSDYFRPNHYAYNLDKTKLVTSLNSCSYKVDSFNEFPFAASALVNAVAFDEGNVILARVKLKGGNLRDVGFNYSIKNAKDSTLFFGGTDVKYLPQDSVGLNVYAQIFMGSEFKKWKKENCTITFFVWNRGKNEFTLSDFQIRTIAHWPARWAWWN